MVELLASGIITSQTAGADHDPTEFVIPWLLGIYELRDIQILVEQAGLSRDNMQWTATDQIAP